MRGDELLDRAKAAAAEFARHSVRPRRIGVDDADQPHRRALLGKLVVNAGVVAAKHAHANHGDVNEVVSGQLFSPQLAGCRRTC